MRTILSQFPITILSLVFTITTLLHTSLLNPSFAHEPTLIVAPAGYFYLSMAEDGTPAIKRVENVIDLGPPTDPPQPPPENIEDQVAEWARSVNDPNTAKPLATLYEQTANLLSTGSLPESQAKLVIEFGTDQLLQATGGTEKWADFRTKVTALEPEPDSSLAALYTSIAKGLRKAHD